MSVLTYLEAIREAIQEVMQKDEDVFIFGEDIGLYGGSFGLTNGLFQEFGKERVRDTPISESVIIGTAVGSAITGMRPILEIMFSDFIGCGMDQLMNQAAKIRYMFGGKAKVPMVLRTATGGGAGFGPHHSQSLESIFALSGLKVVMPSCPYDAKGLFVSSVYDNNPVVFLEHKVLYKNKKYAQEVPKGLYTIPLGKGEVKKPGKDLTIVAYSYMVQKSLEAAEMLQNEHNLDCEVIDLRTIRPLDIDIVLESVEKTGKLVCVEEACGFGGFMGEVVSQVMEKGFDYLDAPAVRVSSKDCPVPYSYILEREMIPSVEKIRDKVLEVSGKK